MKVIRNVRGLLYLASCQLSSYLTEAQIINVQGVVSVVVRCSIAVEVDLECDRGRRVTVGYSVANTAQCLPITRVGGGDGVDDRAAGLYGRISSGEIVDDGYHELAGVEPVNLSEESGEGVSSAWAQRHSLNEGPADLRGRCDISAYEGSAVSANARWVGLVVEEDHSGILRSKSPVRRVRQAAIAIWQR